MAILFENNKNRKISEFDKINLKPEALSYLVIPFAYYNKKNNSYTNVITSLSDISSYMTSYIVNNIFDDLWGEYTPDYKEMSYAYNIIDFHNRIKNGDLNR